VGINLDIAKTPQTAVVNLLLPFVPGGTLIIGILAGAPHWHTVDLFTLSVYERVPLIIFLSYVSGLALVLLVDAITGFLSIAVSSSWSKRLVDRTAPWNDLTWRKTARTFLLLSILPQNDSGSQPRVRCALSGAPDQLWTIANGLVPPLDAQNSESEPEWRCWYQVLFAYVLPSAMRRTRLTEYLMSTLTTLGLVGLVLLAIGVVQHWLGWLFSLAMVCVGWAFKGLTMLSRVYISSSAMTAELLREIIERRVHPGASAEKESRH
jgi:hypothetical protein